MPRKNPRLNRSTHYNNYLSFHDCDRTTYDNYLSSLIISSVDDQTELMQTLICGEMLVLSLYTSKSQPITLFFQHAIFKAILSNFNLFFHWKPFLDDTIKLLHEILGKKARLEEALVSGVATLKQNLLYLRALQLSDCDADTDTTLQQLKKAHDLTSELLVGKSELPAWLTSWVTHLYDNLLSLLKTSPKAEQTVLMETLIRDELLRLQPHASMRKSITLFFQHAIFEAILSDFNLFFHWTPFLDDTFVLLNAIMNNPPQQDETLAKGISSLRQNLLYLRQLQLAKSDSTLHQLLKAHPLYLTLLKTEQVPAWLTGWLEHLTEKNAQPRLKKPITLCKSDIEIGKGSYGRVYRITKKNSKTYILKRYTYSSDYKLHIQANVAIESGVSRLLGETHGTPAIATHLKAPSILFNDNHGLSLDKIRTSQLSAPQKNGIINQVMSGLEHLHDRGILHGDVNPNNILAVCLDEDRVGVKIIDYGLCLCLGSTLIDGIEWITQQYRTDLAWTTEKNRLVEKSWDFFALACTYYKLFTNQLLFEKNTLKNDEAQRDERKTLRLYAATNKTPLSTLTTLDAVPSTPALDHLKYKLSVLSVHGGNRDTLFNLASQNKASESNPQADSERISPSQQCPA